MALFDRNKFSSALAGSGAFTTAQIKALAEALQASLGAVAVPGASHEAAPLRGVGGELS